MRLSENFWAADSLLDGLNFQQPASHCETTIEVKSGGVVVRLHRHPEPVRELDLPLDMENRRDLVCGLCERLVCLKLDIPFETMRSKTRSCAEAALARQIAMYLAHTMFSVLMTEVGQHFCRDRTTVAHACALVEDRRDDFTFDTMMCQLEEALEHAACSIAGPYATGEVR